MTSSLVPQTDRDIEDLGRGLVIGHGCSWRYCGTHITDSMADTTSVCVTVATPSATAAKYTASATMAESALRSLTSGSKAAPGVLTSACWVMACAAAESIDLVTRFAPATITPRPSPGNTRKLLACPMAYVTSPYSIGAMGIPVATRAVHFDQASTSAGIASIFELGFEIGRI